MKINKLFALGALALGSAFAAEESSIPSLYDMCRDALDVVKSKMPANRKALPQTSRPLSKTIRYPQSLSR